MARKLVEYDDVAAAAQRLKDAGKRPTLIAVRDLIGKGSYTTISTFLKQWSEEHSLDDEPVEVILPESVMSDAQLFLQKIYTVAKASADDQLERERELLRQKEIEFQEDMQQVVDIANDATEKSELFEEQLEAITNKKAESDAALAKTENSLSLKSAELERSLTDIEKLEKRIMDLEGKLEAKSTELTRAQDHLEQAEIENRSLSQKLATTEGELAAQKGKSIEQTEKLRAAHEQNKALKEQLENTQAKLAQSQDSLATAKAHGESLERECQRLSGDVQKLESKLSSAEAEARSLVQDKGVIAGQLQEKDQQTRNLEQRLNEALIKISGLELELVKAGKGGKKKEEN
jgi:chromosome segregation ATPase